MLGQFVPSQHFDRFQKQCNNKNFQAEKEEHARNVFILSWWLMCIKMFINWNMVFEMQKLHWQFNITLQACNGNGNERNNTDVH